MKKFIVLALVLGSLTTQAVAAQVRSVKPGEGFYGNSAITTTLKGCIRDDAKTVRCEFSLNVTGRDQAANYDVRQFTAIDAAGKEYKPSGLRVADAKTYARTQFVKLRDGISYPLSLRFETLPSSLNTIKYLDAEGKANESSYSSGITVRTSDVAIRTATPTAKSVASPTDLSPYTVNLTGCMENAQGVLTCTATLTSRR